MLTLITKQTVSSILSKQLGQNLLWTRSASAIPPGIVGKNRRVLPAHMYKPRPRWETGDLDPYPNFDLSKILRPGFENSEELKTFVIVDLLFLIHF